MLFLKSRVSFSFLLISALAFTLSSCATQRGSSRSGAGDKLLESPAAGQGDVSLKADRSALKDLRKEIPDDVKKQNDEIAMIMSFVLRDSEEEPNRLRERFSTAVRKKREATDKQIRRVREDFSKKEKVDRDAFLKTSKEERESYLARRKRTSDDRKAFFDDQEDKRKSFFSDQQEKRKDFESRIMDERKDMEDFIREKQNAFNQEWRAYQQRYTERKKQTDLKKQMEKKSHELEHAGKPVHPVTPPPPPPLPEDAMMNESPFSGANPSPPTGPAADPMAEFEKIPPGPATPLAPGKSGP